MDIDSELFLVRSQLFLLEKKMRGKLKKCHRLSESIENAYPSSEKSDRTLYRSERSFLSMNVSASKK